MAIWSNLFGSIKVAPLGKTQATMDFVLAETITSMPTLLDMNPEEVINVIKPTERHVTCSSSMNGFGQHVTDTDGYTKFFRTSNEYVLTIHEHITGYFLNEAKSEINSWLNNLAKKIQINEILLRISAEDGDYTFDTAEPFRKLYVKPSWEQNENALPSQLERATEWRYEYVPTFFDEGHGAFAEMLVNLVPGGNSALKELDDLTGHKNPVYEETAETLKTEYQKILNTYRKRENAELPWFDD